LTETWLSGDICTCELFPGSYSVLRSDRNFYACGVSKGGGVLLAVKSHLNYSPLNLNTIISTVPSIDIIGAKIVVNAHRVIYVFVIYIPPSSSFEILETFFELLSTTDYVYNDNVVIMGDFNVPNYMFENSQDKFALLIKDYQQLLEFSQYNNIYNSYDRILDLVLSTKGCEVLRDNVPIVEEDAHRPPLIVELSYNCNNLKKFAGHTDYIRYNFKKANYPLLYSLICRLVLFKLIYRCEFGL
jgi:hypothetical protein